MPKKQIDYAKVAAAADKLKHQGREPSLINVSEELGITSWNSNLSSLLDKWYHEQPEFQRAVHAPLSEHINIKTSSILEKNIELEKSLSLLRATLESTADGIMMVNGQGQVVDWNQKFVQMWRIPTYMLESGTEKISFEFILSQLSNPQQLISDVSYLYENPQWQGQLPPLHFKDGRIFERFTQPQRVGSETVGRVYSFRDITQKIHDENKSRIRERAIEASTHGVLIIDISRQGYPIIYINRATERITGFKERDLIGKQFTILRGKNRSAQFKHILLAIKELREDTVELESYRQNGNTYWCEVSVAPVKDAENNIKHFVCLINDITLRREMENQLLKQATHDSLTGLPNRVLLIDRVQQAILQAKKKDHYLAFLFLDLDRFKITNDSLGHSMGDKLLQAVSNRLLMLNNDLDTVARLGGDEFVILLQDVTEKKTERTASEFLEILSKPYKIDGQNLKITGSIGISYFPKDGSDYESLLRSADLSMYQAKEGGRNTFCSYETEMNTKIINRMHIDNALQNALKNNEFYLVYQPLIQLKTSKVVGFEALIRWHNPTLGEVSPIDFIGICEENGLIIDIGNWVLKEACSQLKNWHDEGYSQLSIAVNISSRQFNQDSLPEEIKYTLNETGIDPLHLELELTESLLIDNIDHAVKVMDELKQMGVRLAIDDFGTGYSSLSYLKQFPVHKLKIDRSFISELHSKEKNEAAIVKAIINLGHSLSLEVLAEGVENKEQVDFIMGYSCDYAQGYYFSRPLIASNLKDFLKKYH